MLAVEQKNPRIAGLDSLCYRSDSSFWIANPGLSKKDNRDGSTTEATNDIHADPFRFPE
jgi:hypothetical protein